MEENLWMIKQTVIFEKYSRPLDLLHFQRATSCRKPEGVQELEYVQQLECQQVWVRYSYQMQ